MDHLLTTQNLVTIAMAALMSYVLYRSKTASIWRGEAEAAKTKADRLDQENHSLIQLAHEKDVKIADLEAKTDLSEIRKGQTAIMEIIAKQSAAILENQSAGMERGHNIEKVLTQMVVTLEKMEKRLDRGLIMK